MKKIKVWVKQYPERIVFGVVFIVVLIAFVKINIIGSAENPLVVEIIEKENKIDKIIKTNKPKERDEINQYNLLLNRIKKLEEPQLLNSWFMYRRPIYKVKVTPKPTVIPSVIFPPRLDPLEIKPEQPDCIILAWQNNDQTTARVKGYHVYRKKAADRKFTLLTQLTAGGITPTGSALTSYQDRSVQPETVYIYRITAITDETMVNNKQESSPSNEEKIQTPGIIEITVTAAIFNEMAMIRIKKYIKNAWRQRIFNINKDAEIGKIEKDSQTGEKLDFSTGYFLKDIQKTKELRNIMKIRMFVDVWKITYVNSKTGKEYERKGDKGEEIPLVP